MYSCKNIVFFFFAVKPKQRGAIGVEWFTAWQCWLCWFVWDDLAFADTILSGILCWELFWSLWGKWKLFVDIYLLDTGITEYQFAVRLFGTDLKTWLLTISLQDLGPRALGSIYYVLWPQDQFNKMQSCPKSCTNLGSIYYVYECRPTGLARCMSLGPHGQRAGITSWDWWFMPSWLPILKR